MSSVSRTPNISRSKLSNTQKLLLEKHDAIVLANGKTPFGEDFYVYLKVDKASIEKMQRDVQAGQIVNFFEYGDVLDFGPGVKPPEEVIERIKEKYVDKATFI